MEVHDITPDTIPAEIGQSAAVIKVREVPAAVEARRALLEAIAQEARAAVDKEPGNASAALLELTQAYALLASASVPVGTDGGSAELALQGRSGGQKVGLCLELEP
ncbi:hypothetical protein ABZ942_15725 [Nocardia sp. NPDC046473]|uniref:hypothetical protein n=1 Tax=Nocardia sp. NPDC046473 TaxID=3155733 RepID=UPI0033FB5A1C